MATSKIALTSAWQAVALDGINFIIDNASAYNAQITFSTTPPAVDAAYHTLQAGQGLVRMSLTGDVYARNADYTQGEAFLIVTT